MQAWQRHPSLPRLVTAFAVAALAIPAGAGAWTWPVDGPVLRGFLFSEDNPLAPGQHRGIDIQGGLGDPVLAPAPGTVTFAGRVAANGLTLTIQTSKDYTVTLLHLGASLVGRGDVVAEGQPVATVGTSGVPEYAVPYVQLGVRLSSDPEGYLDPQAFLPPLTPHSVPPSPTPGPQPAPALPPSAATPPPAVAPPADSGGPRAAVPMPPAPDRPVGQPDARRVATPTWQPSGAVEKAVVREERATADASTGTAAALSPHPLETSHPVEADASPSHAAPTHRQPPSRAADRAVSRVRPLDPMARLASVGAPHAAHGSAVPSRNLLVVALGLVAVICLCAYGFRRRAARIIGGDALLPDNADLLRELEPPHRARVHDDRRGRTRPAPQAAR